MKKFFILILVIGVLYLIQDVKVAFCENVNCAFYKQIQRKMLLLMPAALFVTESKNVGCTLNCVYILLPLEIYELMNRI